MKLKNTIMILFIISGILLFNGCQKEDNSNNNLPTKGTVRFTCTSDNPYYLYIDGVFKTTINGNSFIEYDLSAGEHLFKAEQKSGYLLYPTIVQTNRIIIAGQEFEWIFP